MFGFGIVVTVLFFVAIAGGAVYAYLRYVAKVFDKPVVPPQVPPVK